MLSRILPRALLLLLGLQLAWLAAARTATRVGWGFGPAPLPDGTVSPGWMANLTDNLGYATFLQQARWDGGGASLLYTTTPHPAAYFNPLLWGLGRMAALAGTRPEGWLILAGVVAALANTVALYRLGELLAGPRTAFCAAAIGAFGSGWTWIQRLAAKAMGWDHYYAADVRFMDLLPSSAGLFYPLHATGLALLGGIVLVLLRLESLEPGRRSAPGELALIAMGVALSWIRPYEPAVLLSLYGCHVLAGGFAHEAVTRRRARWLLLLAAACLPGLAYAGWLATQPVWDILSTTSLSWGHERRFWLQGFGGLWLAGAAGVWLWRRQGGPARLVVIGYGAAAVLLLLLNIRQTKLLSGCGLVLALASGHALGELFAWGRRRLPGSLAAAAVAAVLLVIAGPGSLVIALRESCLARPGIEAGLWHVADRIRAERPRGIPTVLAESEAGGILPGLIGSRVWAGHWILTDDRAAKEARLRTAGVERGGTGTEAASIPGSLRSLLADSRADFLLLRKGVPAVAAVAGWPELRPVADQDGWLLFACIR